jgi:hypothetical protein
MVDDNEKLKQGVAVNRLTILFAAFHLKTSKSNMERTEMTM